MAEGPHYKELLHTLNEFNVEYLIVGGYAVMKYTEPRYTKDLDIWIGNDRGNAIRVHQALAKFGAPLGRDGVTPETFAREKIVYQIGVAPIRIDIATHIDGVAFSSAWQNRVPGSMFGEPVHFISLRDLIVNKQSTGRKMDLEHLEQIERQAKERCD